MDKEKELTISISSPPGDTLKEHLAFIGMKPAELANKMNMPREIIDDLISGKEPVTHDIATRLERELGIPAAFWRNREREYRQDVGSCGGEG